ncbi:uncharacterized protein FOMMEDRAFT_28747 [Fomitiporia mediterranea MF3/22]|uniref:uncharacterized protein n=1 Tax=Fomitiporia mediterranea (strain MF3/22) TaxID=694068 RepID=UPI000440807F|nr:uncharacterized protein FOMMEDRAFT_28747 [Fomitiporia mediterranea MF3/22]EJD03190.1 hypothetical protein FOMMEDRAFT_28747 [Fomitiporia mediterranea MF3/22]
MPVPTCQEQRQQDSSVAEPANNRTWDIIAMIRAAASELLQDEASDEEVASILARNLDEMIEIAKGDNEFSPEDIQQMKQFLSDNGFYEHCPGEGEDSDTDSENGPTCCERHFQEWCKAEARASASASATTTVTNSHEAKLTALSAAASQWLELLEKLIDAWNIYARIDLYLQTLAQTRPAFANAKTLLSMLHALPKLPRPTWSGPSSALSDGRPMDPRNIMVQVIHSIVWSSNGVMLFPNDIVEIFSEDIKRFSGTVNVQKVITPEQRVRLERIRSFFSEKKKLLYHTPKSNKSLFKASNSNNRKAVVLEAYHLISRLADFYTPFTEPEFVEALSVLRQLRRELQKELNCVIPEADFMMKPAQNCDEGSTQDWSEF